MCGAVELVHGSCTSRARPEGRGVQAHFTLFHELLPMLLASSTPGSTSRVVMLSSHGHRMSTVHLDDINLTNGYDPRVGYCQACALCAVRACIGSLTLASAPTWCTTLLLHV